MVLVVHDPERGDLRELLDFELDLAFGSDENAFELTCAEGLAPAEGQVVFVDGSEYGGIVDETSYDAGRDATGTVTCKGRTWRASAFCPTRAAPASASSARRARCSRRSSGAWGSLAFSPPLQTIRR